MGLEDFEKELAESRPSRSQHDKKHRSRSPHGDGNKHRHHHRSRHDQDSRGHDEDRSRHRHKRSRREGERVDSREQDRRERKSVRETLEEPTVPQHNANQDDEDDDWVEKDVAAPMEEDALDNNIGDTPEAQPHAQRDSWMEAPSALALDYVQRRKKQSPPPERVAATQADYKLKIHHAELNHHLRDLDSNTSEPAEPVERPDLDQPAQHEVKYTFGDAGSSWRMTKLKAVYRQAKESGRPVDDVAIERFGDLRAFDDAREEEIEMDRRKMYGKDYVGKEKPSGELFQDRKMIAGIRRPKAGNDDSSDDESEAAQGEIMDEEPAPMTTVALDQTALNRLKAQMMKAKLKKDPDAAALEAEYNRAMAAAANSRQGDVVVLNRMENRLIAGGRKGEVNTIDNKRGRERGQVTENEDMSISDMVRQEKRTKYNNEGMAFAERIAKDAKFDNDLDYLDENATRLSKAAPKSDSVLRNTAISDYHKTKRILDTCPLCHHEDTDPPTAPQAPIVSLATRVYLTLPTSPEITPYGFCATIVPIQHRLSLLECDDDEWEEIRNFMKTLTRFYASQKPARGVIFYENAAHEGRKRHASLEAVPLPPSLAETAPAFFRESILAADEEWTQHKKIIDTLAKAEQGLGKQAFRKSLVSELPYFHVWFTLDGGFGHIVEDTRRWPREDLFARECLGGMLDVGAEVVKRQGRWRKGDAEMQGRVEKFRKGWERFDWTSVLLDAQ